MNNKKPFPDDKTFERIYEACLENQPQLDEHQRAIFDEIKDETERKFMEYLALLEKEKFKYGYECGYRAGLYDADQPFVGEGETNENELAESWEIARRIAAPPCSGGFTDVEMREIFNTASISLIFDEFSREEAIAKVKEWTDKKEIRVGDVVIADSLLKNGKAIVSRVGIGANCYVIWDDGACGEYDKNDFVKTGCTVDIAGLLAQIGGDKDE